MSFLFASLTAAMAILLIYVFAGPARDAVAQRGAPYQIEAQSGTRNVWMLNTATGKLRLCHPPRTVNSGPACGKWSR